MEALIEAARQARENAYAPYSKFAVGAALRTVGGEVFCGCNVENSSYSLTCCAERAALFSAVAAGHRSFDAIAIVIDGPKKSPCGACRQVLAEFNLDLDVVIAGIDGSIELREKLSVLLPQAFRLASS